FQQGARDGDALALAAGQTHTAFADMAGITVRQAFDKIVRVGHGGGGLYIGIGSVGAAVTDIVQYSAGEQHRLLRNQSDLGAQRGRVEFADIDAVEQNAALL